MSWFERLFGVEGRDATPEAELLGWVRRWKAKGFGDGELAGWLTAMAGQLNPLQNQPYRGGGGLTHEDDWKP